MPGRVSRRVRWALVVLALIVLAVVLPPFLNVNRYRGQVAAAIGRGLGRDVTVANIELTLMPRPGMILSGFVVADAPSYGAEPMLRAETVTAYLRLSSLWRGRLEIGTLSLENPSLNLVRRDDGRWNLLDLVERTSQARSAPTAKLNPESRPRFPYVEATAGRINFKLGLVKKAFAFTDADFALWLETEDLWGVRLEARPTRADVPVGETGRVRIEGQFQRAASLREMPVQLKANYTRGQLGQFTALVYGRDRGWRGTMTSTAALAGTPGSLSVTADAQVDDFRRYDIALGQAIRLAAHCTGTYSSVDDSLRGIQCQAPVRPGLLMLRGDVLGWEGQAFNVGITAEQIPLDRIVALARHTKKDLPEDLTATGSADALFTVRRDRGATAIWSGGGQTTQLALQSSVLENDLEVGPIEFAIPVVSGGRGRKPVARSVSPKSSAATDSALRFVIKPFAMPLGAASPASAEGFFDLSHYRLTLRGEAELTRLLAISRAMGVWAPTVGLAGNAQVDFAIAGAWTGFAPPAPSGKMQVGDATVEFQGVQWPMQVASASIAMADQMVSVSSLSADFKDGPTVTGSVSFRLHCAGSSDCPLQFDLHTPDVSLAELNQVLNPAAQSRPWYHLLAIGQRDDDAILKIHGQGRVSAGRFTINNLTATNVTTNLELNHGALNVRELKADILGGHHEGNWDADFTVSPPKLYGSGFVRKVSMAQVATLMHDPWATGTLSGQYTLGLAGTDKSQLRASATGSALFSWTGGSARHIALQGANAPLTFTSFKGELALRNAVLTCQQCVMREPATEYAVTGTAGLDRSLDLRLEGSGGAQYAISGPLNTPVVKSRDVPQTEAQRR